MNDLLKLAMVIVIGATLLEMTRLIIKLKTTESSEPPTVICEYCQSEWVQSEWVLRN